MEDKNFHIDHELMLDEVWEVVKERKVKKLIRNKDGEIVAVLDHGDEGEMIDDTCVDYFVYCYTCNHRVDHDDVKE